MNRNIDAKARQVISVLAREAGFLAACKTPTGSEFTWARLGEIGREILRLSEKVIHEKAQGEKESSKKTGDSEPRPANGSNPDSFFVRQQ